MPTLLRQFAVQPKGIGRKDFSRSMERSTSLYVTPSLRQEEIAATVTSNVAVHPFPHTWVWFCQVPQADGTWGWVIDTCIVHWFDLKVTIETNHLVACWWTKYEPIPAVPIYAPPGGGGPGAGGFVGMPLTAPTVPTPYINVLPVESSPMVYGYGSASLHLSAGYTTEPGFLYAAIGGAWPDVAGNFDIHVDMAGIVSDLTLPWMV